MLAYRAIRDSSGAAHDQAAYAEVRGRLDHALESGDALAGLHAALPMMRELCNQPARSATA